MTDQTLSARLRDTAENIHSRGPALAAAQMREAAAELDGKDGQIVALREANASLATEAGLWAKPEASPAHKQIEAALADLGDKVCGLQVEHRSRFVTLVYVPMGDPQRDSTAAYLWEATADADPIDDGPEVCCGRGMTTMEALDACIEEVYDAEGGDEEDEDEDEDGNE